MTVLEKIKRCVSLVWDFQEIYGEEDIEEFCRNELRTYPQHDEIMEYFKRIENLEKENSEIKSELAKKADTNHSLVEQMAKLEEENAELKSEIGCETCTKFDKVQLTKAKDFLNEFRTAIITGNWNLADHTILKQEVRIKGARAKLKNKSKYPADK